MVVSAAAFTPARMRAPRVQITKAVPTPPMLRSAIPTATVGCYRRLRSGSRAECDDGRCGSRTAPARDGRPSRLVRGGRPAAQLVGLVRGLHERSRKRKHSGGGLGDRRALHGGGQAHYCLAHLNSASATTTASPATRQL